MMGLWLLLSCATPPEDTAAPASAYEALEPQLLLRRLSLDLRGVTPSIDEVDAVVADPEQVWTYRDAYLQDERFRDRLVNMLAERWLTRYEEQEVGFADYHLESEDQFDYLVSFGSEPLQLMAEVAVSDEPWPTIVTADWTMANEMLGEIWPLDRPEGEGWLRSTWTDQRPPAGVLVSNGLWWRYISNGGNQQRARVAAMSRLLLCEDYLERPVTFSRTGGLDEEATAEALWTDPGCQGCHSSIEPLRVVFYGFQALIQYNAHEADRYHPERERQGLLDQGVDPAYFGTPIEGLADLGVNIAADARFYQCSTEQAAQSLWRRPVQLDDNDVLNELRRDFIDSGYLYRELMAGVTETEAYQAAALTEHASEDQQLYELTQRMVTPDQYASMVEDLTGFVWVNEEGWEVMRSDYLGYRVMAGGVDGIMVTSPQQDPGLTWSLVLKRQAELAANYAVQTELVEGSDGAGLFTGVTLEDAPGDVAFTAKLDELWLRLTAQELDADTRTSLESLFTELKAQSDAAAAWSTLVSVMLRDPLVVTY